MNIRNPDYFLGSFWNWEVFNDCFEGTMIRITDIDGLIERKGHFLVLETKRPGIEVPTGQRILFDQICKDKNWHVLIIWGETDQPQSWQVWKYPKIHRGGIEDLKIFINRWYQYADGRIVK